MAQPLKTRLKPKNLGGGQTAFRERIELTFSRKISSCLEVRLSASEPRIITAVLGVRAQATWRLLFFFFWENASSYCLNVGHTHWCLALNPNVLGPTNKWHFCMIPLKSVLRYHEFEVKTRACGWTSKDRRTTANVHSVTPRDFLERLGILCHPRSIYYSLRFQILLCLTILVAYFEQK